MLCTINYLVTGRRHSTNPSTEDSKTLANYFLAASMKKSTNSNVFPIKLHQLLINKVCFHKAMSVNKKTRNFERNNIML